MRNLSDEFSRPNSISSNYVVNIQEEEASGSAQREPQPQPRPQFQSEKMGECQLKYNYCDCIGCNKKFTEFQKLVEKTYKFGLQKPILDKEFGVVTVIGEGDFKLDATTESILKKLLQKATGKIDVKTRLIPKKESGEANHSQKQQEQEKKQQREEQKKKQQQQQEEEEQKKQQRQQQQKQQEEQQQQRQQLYPMGHRGAQYGHYRYPMNQQGQLSTNSNQGFNLDMFSPENPNSCTVT